MKDHATPEGTKHFADRAQAKGYPESAYRQLGRTQWTASGLGFGTYRVDRGISAHEEALEKALESGCNLIDTSTNYGDGGSERCIGNVLEKMFTHRTLKREELVLVSKVGYVQGENLAHAQKLEREGAGFPDMVKISDHCWHCLHPSFIESQLSLSLERLKIKKIDAYLLHNPEYFLTQKKKEASGLGLAEIRAQFYNRIRNAFIKLEEEVENNRISYYGVSSNTFGSHFEDPEATSLTQMWKIAAHIAQEKHGSPNRHHFCVIQCPGNLFENGAMLQKNNGCDGEDSVVHFAKEKGISVLINRPLNAFVGSQMVRLADFAKINSELSLEPALHDLNLLEQEYTANLHPNLLLKKTDVATETLFSWVQELSPQNLRELNLDQWQQIESQMISPQLASQFQFIDSHVEAEARVLWKAWKAKYVGAMQTTLNAFRSECSEQSQKTSSMVAKRLSSFLPEKVRSESLSRQSLAVLLNTAGVSCVLVGMRRPSYVEDAMGALKLPSFPVTDKLYDAFRFGG